MKSSINQVVKSTFCFFCALFFSCVCPMDIIKGFLDAFFIHKGTVQPKKNNFVTIYSLISLQTCVIFYTVNCFFANLRQPASADF